MSNWLSKRLGLLGVAIIYLAAFSAHSVQAQIVVGDSGVGYIDSAVLGNQIRLRFDAAYSSRFADRAEFLYAQYGVTGAPQLERGIDNHQELATYLEWHAWENFSLFAEVPFRWIDPIVNENAGGLYDVQAGFKASLLESESALLTAQLRAYFPTGDASKSLSTDHVSLEPGLLSLIRPTDDVTIESELRYWIPIDGSTAPLGNGSNQQKDFAGNVLRYGLGASYKALENGSLNVTPVAEVVGWHVFSGLRSDSTGQRNSAVNDAVVNLKIGTRLSINSCCQSSPTSLYVGYGTVLTESNWYSDILRLELRHAF
ncbi:hypothetical protein LOC67_15340 [Stieleria sp. JC731]|uniref:hypothetical protein n=1 Tax=Pirellulaceae TaxID=2691357 RepID=UPI001E4CD1DB|nr:hypothetical protein [Stieleria sp. JC731]MCC9601934.1 hypothetical protein [Stieleria sp. JC731]